MAAADPVGRVVREEQKVLDELARLQRELEETRRRRRQAADAFNAFLSTFPRRDGVSDGQTATHGSRERSFAGTRSSRLPSSVPAGAPKGDSTHAAPYDGMSRGARTGMLVAAAALAVAMFLLLTRPWGGAEPAVVPAVTSTSDAPVAGAPVANEARAPGPPSAELITVRQVWMRVIVDGARVVEREVPAGTSIPLAGRDVVVRAGDAGAVRFLRRGEDQGALGADGAVVTRTFLVVAE